MVENVLSTFGLELLRTQQLRGTPMLKPLTPPNHHHFSTQETSLSIVPKMVKAESPPNKCTYQNRNITGIVSLYRNKSSFLLLKAIQLPTRFWVPPFHSHLETALSKARLDPRGTW